MAIQSTYLKPAFHPVVRRKTVAKLVTMIKGEKIDFDVIAFRGMSGAMIAPLVADKMGKPTVLVRKPEDNSHSYCKSEGENAFSSYIIIDDLISSGSTIKEIIVGIDREYGPTKCNGIFLYEWRQRYVDDYINHPQNEILRFVHEHCLLARGFQASEEFSHLFQLDSEAKT